VDKFVAQMTLARQAMNAPVEFQRGLHGSSTPAPRPGSQYGYSDGLVKVVSDAAQPAPPVTGEED
jgi:hypothetical protein